MRRSNILRRPPKSASTFGGSTAFLSEHTDISMGVPFEKSVGLFLTPYEIDWINKIIKPGTQGGCQ
jgi:hypothetical protein